MSLHRQICTDAPRLGLEKTRNLTEPLEDSGQGWQRSEIDRFDVSGKQPLHKMFVEGAREDAEAKVRRRRRAENKLKREVCVQNAYKRAENELAVKDFERVHNKALVRLNYMKGTFKEATVHMVAPASGKLNRYSPFQITSIW